MIMELDDLKQTWKEKTNQKPYNKTIMEMIKPLSSVMYWTYVAFCIGLAAFYINNYIIANRMQRMDGILKENLEQQITLLETRMKWKIIGLRVVLLFFIVLVEV